MSQNRKNKLQIKDFISIGIYTALYFFMIIISNLLVVFLIPGYSYVYIPVMAALLSGTTFMLMAAKVPKFGAITVMGLIVGLFQFMIGLYPGSVILGVAIASLADLLAYAFKYNSKKGLLFSYAVFSFNTIGPIVPMFIFPSMYVEHLVEQGRNTTYIENAFTNISQNTLLLVTFGILLAAIIGGLFGQRMMEKHFNRAGIA